VECLEIRYRVPSMNSFASSRNLIPLLFHFRSANIYPSIQSEVESSLGIYAARNRFLNGAAWASMILDQHISCSSSSNHVPKLRKAHA
jgi:hypothetical protein